MKWFKIDDVQPADTFIKKFKVDGRNICVVGYEGNIYALSARCPHAGEDLSRGWCKEGKLVCPVHRFSYSLENGRGSAGQNDYVRTYPVKIAKGEVFVGVSSFWQKITCLFGRRKSFFEE